MHRKLNFWHPPFIIAHRGARSCEPENTILAFRKALELGADGIECDVHMSLDDIPVVIHDETVDRTTSAKGPVREFTAEQLGELGIPTLEQTLECLPNDAVINVELKTVRNMDAVRDVLKPHQERLRILISSFDSELVHPWTDYPTGLLFESGQHFQLPIVWRPDALNLNPELLAQAPPGYRIVLWTAKNIEEARLWIAQGADGVIAEF